MKDSTVLSGWAQCNRKGPYQREAGGSEPEKGTQR